MNRVKKYEVMKNVENEVWKRISDKVDGLWGLVRVRVREKVEENVSGTVRMRKLWNQAGSQVNMQISIHLNQKNNHE
jgi:hypothetical protein